jgi:hypothetical protein
MLNVEGWAFVPDCDVGGLVVTSESPFGQGSS